MQTWILCLILATNFVSLAFVFAFCLYIQKKITSARETFNNFVSSPGEGKPSPLAVFVANAGQVIGTQLKTSIMGTLSGDARAVKGLQADVVLDQAEKASPLLAGLVSYSPRLARKLAKNPELIQAALSLLPGLMGKKGPSNGNGAEASPPDIQSGFKL
jgi:hypothetical protein